MPGREAREKVGHLGVERLVFGLACQLQVSMDLSAGSDAPMVRPISRRAEKQQL